MVKQLIRRSIVGFPVSVLLIGMLLFLPGPSLAAPNASSFTWKNYELSATPGVTCPNTAKTCTNTAAEPAIRADKSGNFYASSENGLGAGTDA